MKELCRESVAGFVLAGGHSRRMGRDKALLSYGHTTMLGHALGVMRAVCDEVAIAGSRDDLSSFASVVADQFIDCGPLSGMHAALQHSKSDWNIFLAVDLARVEPLHVKLLLKQPRLSGTVAVIAEADGQLQPLLGLYHRKLAGPIERALLAGERAVISVIESICTPNGLLRVVFPASALINLNTPDELAALFP